MQPFAAVILAAGQSTRMKSKKTKVLHHLAGRPVISYPIKAAKDAGASKIIVVSGSDNDDLKAYLKNEGTQIAIQKKPLGTANAVEAASSSLESFDGMVLIMCGDAPLIRGETLKHFVSEMEKGNAHVGVITMTLEEPSGYGRIVRDKNGRLLKIVEEKDADEEEKQIHEVNSGFIAAERSWLFKTLKSIDTDNAKGEFYLTDLVAIAASEGLPAIGVNLSPPKDFLGINTRVDLSIAEALMRERINIARAMEGVGIIDHRNTTIDADVSIGMDTVIMPYSFLLGKTKIGRDCTIENGVVIRDAVIGDGVLIKAYSVIEDSYIADEAVVGPFARLRPGSKMGKKARVGNFVELKKCELKEGSKANHLSYLGDASIGANVNVGCGTITCNYDGLAKYKTWIGSGSFIGSDVQFVAPVKIGGGSVIGAGSTITKDVPAGALALSRAEQIIVKGWANRRKLKNQKPKPKTKTSKVKGRNPRLK